MDSFTDRGEETTRPRALELFAGVGGFHLALDAAGIDVVWSNQWEPSTKSQPAFDCIVENVRRGRLPAHEHVNEDIAKVLDEVAAGTRSLPRHDLVVGGFPCQDYSVAKTLNQAAGLQGRKGVLWWEIHRLLSMRNASFAFLENVDRLLKSPASQRGRDFAVMLASLSDLGYSVEWRVVNAADYGFPQKRRRVFIIARKSPFPDPDAIRVIYAEGVLARALPVVPPPLALPAEPDLELTGDLADISQSFGRGLSVTPFKSAGVMIGRKVWTRDVKADHDGTKKTLGDILEPDEEVPARFFITQSQVANWQYLKGAKKEERVHKGSGTPYFYSEGPIPFPDPTDGPSRTILTGEGGSSASRFKHVIATRDGTRYRRLTPRELERLNGFPDDWTDTGMSDGRRAFCMGNALVVGLVERIAVELGKEIRVSRPSDVVEVAG